MEETFYAVQQVINGRAGTLPSKFSSLSEARAFINKLKRISKSNDFTNITVEYHLYEIKELSIDI